MDNKGEKCIFVGYSDESKTYKLYNPSTKKAVISRDVQFIEEEAWDGSLEKTMNVKTTMSHEEEEEGTTVNNPSMVAPPPPPQAQQTTPQVGNRIALRNQGSASSSTPQGTKTPLSSTRTTSTPRRPRFENLSEIYEQGEVNDNSGLKSLFSLYCHVDDPIHFEDAINEEKWIEVMDE